MQNNTMVINHPLVQHKLSLMRKKDTSTQSFRRLIREVGTLLAYEVTKDLPVFLESLVAFECHVSALHEGGDHRIILGEVEKFHIGQGDPLLYFRSHYARLES